MNKIKINSSKVKKGNELLCIKELNVLLTPGKKYEILDVLDHEIWMMDNDNDASFPSKISLEKTYHTNIFKHFEVW